MLLRPSNTGTEVLGYQLREKIGAGGYGEVWAAEAPGGLKKAVKLVFGQHDDERAARELKSLQRVKEVRHPFLLSLERIEVVDGRLVVVTELADKSLKDRFVECVESGLAGIPRDELMTYVSDAAEALDYLSDTFSLQHLDIKPENLLLVGGHVKVADFGLVKDIDGTQSMMAGLTPTYAPPELFDGRPSDRSDQYSLGIVFQEMLTGIRPFDGTTAAQLASQHLHREPDLEGLPASDRRAIKRALAKSPEARFENCRSLVTELKRIRRSRPARAKSANIDTDSYKTSSGTLLSNSLPSMAAKHDECRLAPLDGTVDAVFRPTLFIGIGQTATAVLRYLKRRLRERLGSDNELPSLKVLCLDTDTKNLERASRSGELASLNYDDVLPIPLGSSAEYRNKRDINLHWLSRRWIYNVPRSQQTECLRPLGRLAFVDHHDKIFEKIDQLVDGITQTDAVAKTAEKTQLIASSNTPRVFVVASISGGIGSGMLADMAYAVRTVIGEHGFDDADVHGLLLSTSGRSSVRKEVTVANTFCCLSELNHFGYAASYPGDAASDLPGYDDRPPFDHTYLVDLGNDPLPDEFEATADELAEYLYLNAATSCGSYLDTCRESDALAAPDGFLLRTLGLSHTGWMGGDVVSLPANVLVSELLKSWVEPPNNEETVRKARSIVDQLLAKLELSSSKVIDRVGSTLTERLGRSLDEIVSEELVPFAADAFNIASQQADLSDQVVGVVDRILGVEDAGSEGRFEARLTNVMEVTTKAMTDELTKTLTASIIACLDQKPFRLWGAELIRHGCLERLQQVEQDLKSLKEQHLSSADSCLETLSSPISIQDDDEETDLTQIADQLSQQVRTYGETRVNDFLLDYAQQCIAQVLDALRHVDQLFGELESAIKTMSSDCEQRFAEQERLASMGCVGQRDIVSSVVFKRVTNELSTLAEELNDRIQGRYFDENGGLRRLVQEQVHNWRRDFARTTYVLAREVVCDEVERSDLDKLLEECDANDSSVVDWIKESVALSVPHLLNTCGGTSRYLVAIPRGSSHQFICNTIEAQANHDAKAFPVTHGDVAFCCEASGIPASQVAAMLVQGCPGAGELVSRIHTRTDIKWKPIIQL